MEVKTTAATFENFKKGIHPPILLAISPDGQEAMAAMDPAYRAAGEKDLKRLYPFAAKGKSYFCRHWKTGAELAIDDPAARKAVAQVGAAQWIDLMNLMQAFFRHGPVRKNVTVTITTDSFQKSFDDFDAAMDFLYDMQEQ